MQIVYRELHISLQRVMFKLVCYTVAVDIAPGTQRCVKVCCEQ